MSATRTPEVSTSQYEFAHGRQPRGTGTWAFFFDRNTQAFWVPNASYSEARRQAVQAARAGGYSRVEVGS